MLSVRDQKASDFCPAEAGPLLRLLVGESEGDHIRNLVRDGLAACYNWGLNSEQAQEGVSGDQTLSIAVGKPRGTHKQG